MICKSLSIHLHQSTINLAPNAMTENLLIVLDATQNLHDLYVIRFSEQESVHTMQLTIYGDNSP